MLGFVIPDIEISKGIIVGKHTDAGYKINHVYIIGDIPVCSDETIPTKYYLDIRGYDQNNKIQTITNRLSFFRARPQTVPFSFLSSQKMI